jgi:hypothetical protein
MQRVRARQLSQSNSKSHNGNDKFHSYVNLALYIVWHVDPLLGNDRESSSYTTVAKQRLCKEAFFHGNNCTTIMELCFLCGPCRDGISRTVQSVSEELVGE